MDDLDDLDELQGGAGWAQGRAVTTMAQLHVLTGALAEIMAWWLASVDANRAASLLRELEAATAIRAAERPVDVLERDRFLLGVDKFGAAFYDRLRRRSEQLRVGHRGGRL